MELWDAYDKNFIRIEGVTLKRGEKIGNDVFHLVCDIIVRHTDGDYLIMQRDARKHYGGMWEATAGGSALKGESPLQCAARELFEETGIKSDDVDNYNPIDIDDFDFDIPYIPYNNAIIDDEIIIHRPVIAIPYILTTNDETFLGNCSVILRNIYNIPDNEKFTISREYISNNPSPINLTVYANKWHFNAITFRHLHQLYNSCTNANNE